MAKGGQPTKYSAEWAVEFCRRVGVEGMSMQDICAQPDMPSMSSVCLWLNEHSEFSEMYTRAREQRADVLFEEVIKLADECPLDKDAAAAYRLKVDARKWAASKLNTVRYGDRQQLDVTATIKNVPDEQLEARLAQLLGKAGAGQPS